MKEESIIVLIISGLFSIINYLFWSRIKKIETDTSANSKSVKEIETNYINRFDEIKETLNTVEKNIIDRIHTFELNLVENYVHKKECKFNHLISKE